MVFISSNEIPEEDISKLYAFGRPPVDEQAIFSVSTFKNDIALISNITLFDEENTKIETVYDTFNCEWFLPFGTYYVQATTVYNEYTYLSNKIKVALTENTQLGISFLFCNFTVTQIDIKGKPLGNCTLILTREDELHVLSSNSSGLATFEAYYGNWTLKAYWMNVLVKETGINVDQPRIDVDIKCNVGDFTVIVVDQYGSSIMANVTLTNAPYNLTFTEHSRKLMENTTTFNQIPLIQYNLTVKVDFEQQSYHVNTEQIRQIQIEVLPLFQKIIYILIGISAGIFILYIGMRIHKTSQG